MRAFLNYYITITLFNVCFTLATAVFGNLLLMPVVFCTGGFIFSLLAFNIFFRNQYYFYHNAGYSRKRLALTAFAFNLVPAIVLLLLFFAVS